MDAWLRGPIAGVPPRLMPVAHGLTHALEDVERAAAGLAPDELWVRPGGAASVGFHLRHIAGVIDRLLTYARGESLLDAQFQALAAEQEPGSPPATAEELVGGVRAAVEKAVEQLRRTPPGSLLERRAVGRKGARSNVLGVLSHAAGHAERHAGQVVATATIVRVLGLADVPSGTAQAAEEKPRRIA